MLLYETATYPLYRRPFRELTPERFAAIASPATRRYAPDNRPRHLLPGFNVEIAEPVIEPADDDMEDLS